MPTVSHFWAQFPRINLYKVNYLLFCVAFRAKVRFVHFLGEEEIFPSLYPSVPKSAENVSFIYKHRLHASSVNMYDLKLAY